MKTVNLEDNIHKMLSEISEHKKNKGEIIRTKKDVLADLVMGAHIRMKREQKKAPELFEGTTEQLNSLGIK